MTIGTLMAAMVVSSDLREKMLNPETRENALKAGYLGHDFGLTKTEQDFLMRIEAESLADFAQRIIESEGAYLTKGRRL